MASWKNKFYKLFLRGYLASIDQRSLNLAQRRQRMDSFTARFKLPKNLITERVEWPSFSGEWLYFPGVSAKRVLLYLHGGAYVMGSVHSHRHLIARLAKSANVRVLAIDYRLAPEHRFPAALEDAVASYHWLLEHGLRAHQITFAGDSAGGGLALATLLLLRDSQTPLPAAVVCLSPWVDLTCSGASYKTKAKAEVILREEFLRESARSYLKRERANQPLASPLFGDLRNLPPCYIQVGTDEILLNDAERFAEAADRAGVNITLEIWDEMIHVWQYFVDRIPEAQTAIDMVGTFIRKHLG